MLRQLALPVSRAFTAYTGDDTAINGAACYLPDRIGHLFKCRPPPPSDIMQPGDRQLHWLPIAVDGTSRHEALYVHCTLGGTVSPNQLSSWWLLGGSEKWETLYAASQEIDFDDELRKAATVSFKDTGGNDRQSLFFLSHVPPVPSIEHWKRDQYCPVTGGNFRKSVPTCMRYASVRCLEVFPKPLERCSEVLAARSGPKTQPISVGMFHGLPSRMCRGSSEEIFQPEPSGILVGCLVPTLPARCHGEQHVEANVCLPFVCFAYKTAWRTLCLSL